MEDPWRGQGYGPAEKKPLRLMVNIGAALAFIRRLRQTTRKKTDPVDRELVDETPVQDRKSERSGGAE